MDARDAAQGPITTLLAACGRGESGAFEALVPLVYDDLRGIAHRQLRREPDGHTLSTTAVVHEAYLHLADQTRASWNDRVHFFAVAAVVMRHILVDYARRHAAQRRGGDRLRIPLRPGTVAVPPLDVDLLDLDDALTRLAEHDARLSRVVECRYFGGLTIDETAEALRMSRRTVERDWMRAKAHLYQLLEPSARE